MTPRTCDCGHRGDPLDDHGEPGDLRALVARVFRTPPRPATPLPRPSARPSLRTET